MDKQMLQISAAIGQSDKKGGTYSLIECDNSGDRKQASGAPLAENY